MITWNDYKENVKKIDPESGRDIVEVEEQAAIISAMIEQRKIWGLSQREFADSCRIPQSSVARIESLRTTPNLGTLLKILRQLGLKLTIDGIQKTMMIYAHCP